MKIRFLIIPGLFLCFSCTHSKVKEERPIVSEYRVQVAEKDSFPSGEIIPVVSSNKNKNQSFALYLPLQYKADHNSPALILLDPKGDGAFPLIKYRFLAEKFGVVLIGSNDSKNGITFDETNIIIQILAEEAAVRLKVDTKQISLAGFSGGAKAALAAASQLPSILSVIYCGAGLPAVPNYLPPALGIAGTKDMNFTEVIQTDGLLEAGNFRHALIWWDGKHEWSDSVTFQNAFYWMRFKAMENKLAPADDDLAKTFIKQNNKPFAEPLNESRRLKKIIGFLEGVTDVTADKSELAKLKNHQKYLSAAEKQQSDFGLEARMKQNYLQCITLNDPLWWRDELSRMRSSGSSPVNDRILGYISLACYSYSAGALKNRDLSAAQKYLAIYALVDRENPDRAFMQACLYGLLNNKTGALQSISEAIRYGFRDKSKLLAEPALSVVSNTAEFNELLRKIN